MKRTILSLIAIFMVTIAWADDITAQQALQQAKSFLQQRETTGSRPKHAQGSAAQQLTMTKQVCGLYVFNIKDNGGFVIVSNDDCVRPILGFSDSGALDPDNMPSNMRAWLQGYADEIAWAKQHNVAKTAIARVKGQHRVGSHATTAIAPLVKTTWNQGAPYNNMTPYYKWNGNSYAYSATEESGYQHCATGCVATAMAQVMKYHKWPTAATQPIPNYRWENLSRYKNDGNDYGPGALSATTFDWNNMLNSYSSTATGTTADAVATLMKYCGYSVEMNYGPSSGSNTNLVADALKAYFDYDETTQFVSRSYYTYANWTDLIYHELYHHRPVVYGGSSSGGGHEFVCDGYKYEDDTDFFHINWGWGGMSDNYFVLSALDPDQQGIGGSSSDDGYHFGQDAVIGIQKKNGGGTIADIQQSTINLKLNSMTLERSSVPTYMRVDVTLNITNKSSNDYDGDVWIGSNEYGLLTGTNCSIPAGKTRDVVVSFVPDYAGTYSLIFFWPNTYGSYSSDWVTRATLTVTEGAANKVVPINGYWCDDYSRSQFIIPATDLQDFVSANLSSMTFYSATPSASWGNAEFDVFLKEVSETTLSSLKDWTTLNKVYAGKLSISNNVMTITFDTPYHYDGGNLLVGINQTVKGTYNDCIWAGKQVSGASMGGYGTSISQQNFLPITTFEITSGGGPIKPGNVAAHSITGSTATITWTGFNDDYNVQYRTAGQDAILFYDSFEDGLDQWTVIRNGEGNQYTDWRVVTSATCFNNNSIPAHDGEKVAMSRSWSSDAYNVDNWLITPQVTLKGTLKFWVLDDGSYHEHYDVYVSTTTKDITSFTKIHTPGNASAAWTEVTVDLSSYGGQKGYIALRHTDNNQDYLFIDDFGIYAEAAPAGAWQTVTATQASTQLTGLTANTEYEVQVQGKTTDGVSEWSTPATFSTNNTILGDANSDNKVTITDAVGVVNAILGNPSTEFNAAAANVNGDVDSSGEPIITITDAVGVVNIILNSGGSAPALEAPATNEATEQMPE